MDYHFKTIKKTFDKAQQIAEETYQIFLSELSDDDIKCYNDIASKTYDAKKKRFEGNEKLLNILDSVKSTYKFDKTQSKQRFLKMKSLIGPVLNKIEKIVETRQKYYSSFVCSMCSPMFAKLFAKNDKKYFQLEVNSHMCKRLLKKRIAYKNSLYLYKYLQDVVNLTYCARKNSKKEKFDYEDYSWEDHNLVTFDLETLPDYMEKRRKCLNTPNAFILNNIQGVDCRGSCKHSLKLFDEKITKLDKYIKIENDLTQMFFNRESKEKTKERLDKRMKFYTDLRQKKFDEGVLFTDKKTGQERIMILKADKEDDVDLKGMEIVIDKHLGLNVQNTPMDNTFYLNNGVISKLTFILGLLFMSQLLNN
jgi:hypothetical protein